MGIKQQGVRGRNQKAPHRRPTSGLDDTFPPHRLNESLVQKVPASDLAANGKGLSYTQERKMPIYANDILPADFIVTGIQAAPLNRTAAPDEVKGHL